MLLHQQSHFYPCQLASIKDPSTNTQKFFFHSPFNSYSTLYHSLTHDCDFLDHQQMRYSKLSTLKLGQRQTIALLSNSNSINFIGQSPKVVHSIRLNTQYQILSNITTLPLSFINRSDSKEDSAFTFAYLSTMQDINSLLTIKKFEQKNTMKQSKDLSMNPESDKCIKTQQDSCQTLSDSVQPTFNQLLSIQTSIPFPKQEPLSSQSIQIKFNLTNSSNRSVRLFNKKSSILYTYDLEHETFTNTISCSHDQQNQLITEYQSNRVSFLSQNLIINCHSNGVIKLVDERVGRVVHVRDLLSELAIFGQGVGISRQENVIKFWDQQKNCTVDQPVNATGQFLINLKNSIYQMDLRNNRLLKQDSVFEFESPEQLTNYEIAQSNNKKLYAFTTQSHSNYKAYLFDRSQTY